MSVESEMRLATCHPDLQRLFHEVAKVYKKPFTIIEGHRDEFAQNQDFKSGRSKLRWPKSMHNKEPSLAVDAAPSPIDWSDDKRFTLFAGIVMGVADTIGIKIRWGGDWKDSGDPAINQFNDLVHFELVSH